MQFFFKLLYRFVTSVPDSPDVGSLALAQTTSLPPVRVWHRVQSTGHRAQSTEHRVQTVDCRLYNIISKSSLQTTDHLLNFYFLFSIILFLTDYRLLTDYRVY